MGIINDWGFPMQSRIFWKKSNSNRQKDEEYLDAKKEQLTILFHLNRSLPLPW